MKMFFGWMLLSLTLFAVGCGSPESVTATNEAGTESKSQYVSQYVAESEPVDAIPVGEAREKIEDGQEVTLVGLIGGSSKPFVDGLAAFTIVDAKVPFCSADEGCPTPWDYCCESDAVKSNIATIKVVDESGMPVVGNAKEILNVKELSTVVVKGQAKRDDQGNLSVTASSIFVRPGK